MEEKQAGQGTSHFWKGMAMGIAEVIPGVSGGTIAFITGIYERLLNVISSIRPGLWTTFKSKGWKAVWQEIDGAFLIWLLGGMGTGVVIGVFGLTWVLENYPQLLWAFFTGLILASSYFIGKQVKQWNWIKAILLFAGVFIAYRISISIPIQADPGFLYLIFCGSVAISALILPGISGSFILLILGMYTVVIPSLKELIKDPIHGPWLIILPFAIGCAIGLFSVARLLTWTFKRYHDQTLALLTGFILGSMHKLWPWRNVIEWINKDNNARSSVIPDTEGKWMALVEKNVLPWDYSGDPLFIPVFISFLAGLILLVFMERKSS